MHVAIRSDLDQRNGAAAGVNQSVTKRVCITSLVLAAVALGMGALLVRPRGIGPASFQRIQSGMSLQEVETVIGLPHGDYFMRRESVDDRGPYWGRLEQGGEPVDRLRMNTTKVGSKKVSVRTWRGNDHYLQIAFDENDRAVAWSLHEAAEWSLIGAYPELVW
jgi:hypothetical protein